MFECHLIGNLCYTLYSMYYCCLLTCLLLHSEYLRCELFILICNPSAMHNTRHSLHIQQMFVG